MLKRIDVTSWLALVVSIVSLAMSMNADRVATQSDWELVPKNEVLEHGPIRVRIQLGEPQQITEEEFTRLMQGESVH